MHSIVAAGYLFYRKLKGENVTEEIARHQKLARRNGEKSSETSPVHRVKFDNRISRDAETNCFTPHCTVCFGYRVLKLRVGGV